MTTEQIVAEIKGVASYISKRGPDTEGTTSMLIEGFANTVVKQLASMKKFTRQAGIAIQECLDDVNPYGDSVGIVQAALDAKMTALNGSTVEDTMYQNIDAPWQYYTSEDWDVFRDPRKPWDVKVCRAVERPMVCGCKHPNEETLGRILAMLCSAHYDALPDATALFTKLQDLKRCVAAERKPYTLQQLKHFPSSPSLLLPTSFNLHMVTHCQSL